MSDNKNKINKKVVGIVALSIVAFAGILMSIALIFKYSFSGIFVPGEAAYSPQQASEIKDAGRQEVLDDLRSQLSSGTGIYTLLREYFPDQLVYVSQGKYYFVDINKNLKMHKLQRNGFTADTNGVLHYNDASVETHRGIDVSKYQGDIDFSKVKSAGVEYVMMRCGYRSYGSGVLTEDTNFSTYAENATRNGLKAGVYFFTQAINKQEAVEEANYVLDLVKPYNITYPIVLDVEEIYNDTYRQENLSVNELTDVVIAFCDRIRNAGYTPMIYANLKTFAGKLDMTRLESYEKWYAYYDTNLYFPYEISMWQYTESGTIDGINGDVDFDISFKTWGK
jgi:GH25 family lysozyme M1 (1,4-beta-N-acetylmuramidase)